jgi:hypothetical protein
MKMSLCGTRFVLLIASAAGAQATNDSDWVGVWQAELDGQPSTILTLAEDTGSVQGTLVLNGLNSNGGTPHIAVHETHVLMHPKVNGTTLSFAVKRLRESAPTMEFTVQRTTQTTAKIHCLNCGASAPVVEITKQN